MSEENQNLVFREDWKSTNYHGHVKTDSPIKLENGCWYEIGFRNVFGKKFVNQGIYKFNNGFFDEGGYHLKPFPTHARKIELSAPVGEALDWDYNEGE